MALSRNTGTTLGGLCVNLLINDGGAVVDIGSAPATLIVDPAVTFGSATWDGVSRPYFQTTQSSGAFKGITFSANPPVLKHGSGEGGSGWFVAMCKGGRTTSDNDLVLCPSDNFSAGLSIDAGGSSIWKASGKNGTIILSSGVADTNTTFGANKAITANLQFNVANGRQIVVDDDTGTKTAFDADATEGGNSTTGTSILSIGGSTQNGTYCESRIFVFANFSRKLTIAEFQTLRDDWYAQLIVAASSTIVRQMMAHEGG